MSLLLQTVEVHCVPVLFLCGRRQQRATCNGANMCWALLADAAVPAAKHLLGAVDSWPSCPVGSTTQQQWRAHSAVSSRTHTWGTLLSISLNSWCSSGFKPSKVGPLAMQAARLIERLCSCPGGTPEPPARDGTSVRTADQCASAMACRSQVLWGTRTDRCRGLAATALCTVGWQRPACIQFMQKQVLSRQLPAMRTPI